MVVLIFKRRLEMRILLINHLNFLRRDQGCSLAVYEPIKILKSMGCTIDFFTINFYENFSDFDKYNTEGIISTLMVADWDENPIRIFIRKCLNKIKKILALLKINSVYYYPFAKMPIRVLKTFHKIINNGNYDFVYIHYYYWHELIIKTIFPKNTKVVAHVQDMLFTQLSFLDKNISIENLGCVFAAEIRNLHHFHSCFFISFDEYLLAKHFVSDVRLYCFPYVATANNMPSTKKNIDLLYLGHNNLFNVQGAKWFLDSVLPYLHQNISITFCGKMISGLSADYRAKIIQSGITTIEFAENFDVSYSKTKVVMVPMLGGTGMKIKTVEAIAYGIPVVSTLFGMDGFPDKFESGSLVSDDHPIEFALYINNLLSNDGLYHNTANKQNAYYKKYFLIFPYQEHIGKGVCSVVIRPSLYLVSF
jgi:glycosyltransferase involved in cell wall biosynthesis